MTEQMAADVMEVVAKDVITSLAKQSGRRILRPSGLLRKYTPGPDEMVLTKKEGLHINTLHNVASIRASMRSAEDKERISALSDLLMVMFAGGYSYELGESVYTLADSEHLKLDYTVAGHRDISGEAMLKFSEIMTGHAKRGTMLVATGSSENEAAMRAIEVASWTMGRRVCQYVRDQRMVQEMFEKEGIAGE